MRPIPVSLARQVVPPEYGTSRDPLKILTSLPRALFDRAIDAWQSSGFGFGNIRGRTGGWVAVRTESLDGGNDDDVDNTDQSNQDSLEGFANDFEAFDDNGEGMTGGVVISGLRKEFGSKVAVAGLDLRLRPGDITCLLGHNGAGGSRVMFCGVMLVTCYMCAYCSCFVLN